MSLPQIFVDKARDELHETENVRAESLRGFREWIARHEYFADCRKDDTFLLQFLRTKKFHMDKTFELFESYMLLKHSVPRWYDFNEEAISRLWMLYETGFAYPLVERDEEGRRVILVQLRKIDPKFYTSGDIIHLMTWIARAILEEEETQIAGIVTVVDLSEVTFGHVRLLTMSDTVDFISLMRNGVVGRQKGMYLVSLPSFGSFLFHIAKKAANEKQSERIHNIEDMDQVKEIIGEQIFPLELGGSIPEAEMMSTFKKFADSKEDDLRLIQSGVDWDRVALDGEDTSCSMM